MLVFKILSNQALYFSKHKKTFTLISQSGTGWSRVKSRVSKSCNHAITQMRKIFENKRKCWTNERKTGKTGINFMSWSAFLQSFSGFTCILIAQTNLLLQLRKIFENLRKCWTNERKTGKTGINFMALSVFLQSYAGFTYFLLFFCAKFSIRVF